MTQQTQASPVDLGTTTLADLASMVAKSIADTLDAKVRRIVREELEIVRQAGDP